MAKKIGIILGGNRKGLKFLNPVRNFKHPDLQFYFESKISNGVKEAKEKIVKTPYGKSQFFLFTPHQKLGGGLKNLIILFRHRKGNQKIPPHKINYRANIFGFKKLGVKNIFAFNSVGSLKKEIKPGEVLIPSDFIDFDPPTFFDKKLKHITPEISPKLREVLISILRKLKIKFRGKGIYFQTKGPRLETKGEINLIKNFADVVGMTMAKEATLAMELDLEYASLCFIDNYAHGLIKKPPAQKEIEKNQKKNKKTIEKIIKELLRTNKI